MPLHIHGTNAADPYLRASFDIRHRLRRLLWQITWAVLCRPTPNIFHGWRAWVLRRAGANIGTDSLIYPGARIWAPWLLTTGEVVTIANGAEIYNPGGVILEHHSILSQGSFLCGATHDYNDPGFPMIWKPILVGPYGWICARAVVLPGVTVGEGAILGAAAVTSRNLDAWSVYAGNPARKVGERTKPTQY